MADRYSNFAALEASERKGEDWNVKIADRGTAIVILAPHGGFIEPGTSQIAEAIAGDQYSYYCFEGLRPGRPHRDLHITSHRFDEPQGLHLASASRTALAIHGRADADDPVRIWLGGRHTQLKEQVATAMDSAGFGSTAAPNGLSAMNRENICNRGTDGAGVQLELPRALRTRLINEPPVLEQFAVALRIALTTAGFD